MRERDPARRSDPHALNDDEVVVGGIPIAVDPIPLARSVRLAHHVSPVRNNARDSVQVKRFLPVRRHIARSANSMQSSTDRIEGARQLIDQAEAEPEPEQNRGVICRPCDRSAQLLHARHGASTPSQPRTTKPSFHGSRHLGAERDADILRPMSDLLKIIE